MDDDRQLRTVTHVGSAYLDPVTDLCRRIRAEHPTRGVWEAADFQWWWRTPRRTDGADQRFWLDEDGRPIAAAVLTDWNGSVAVDVLATQDVIDLAPAIWHRAIADARPLGARIEVMVDLADTVMRSLATGAGLVDAGGRGGSAWMSADAIPAVSPLPPAYRSTSRRELGSDRPHHFVDRNGPDVEARLGMTSLYRDDLDLVVLAGDDVVAYGLFWLDPVTHTGFVEPMGTDPAHRKRGLARHMLTRGLDALVRAGAERIRINYDADNDASRSLYLGVGFEPAMETALFVTPQRAGTGSDG